MKSIQNRLVLALAFALAAPVVLADSLNEAGRRMARSLASPQTKALLETRAEKSIVYPRLSPELNQMAFAGKSLDLDDLTDKALRLDVPIEGRNISVRLWAKNPAGQQHLSRAVAYLGGTVEEESYGVVFARLPVAALEDINDLDALAFAEPQSLYHGNAAHTGQVGEGVRSVAVEELHRAGITGKIVKIGILDFGFAGYDALRVRGEVPQPVAAQAFNSGADLGGGGDVHGTACTEIIYDMAPDADIYIAAIGQGGRADDASIIRGARWLASQGVDIINFSGGNLGSAKNGSAPLDQLVDEISSQGILWTIAAGNEGAEHWLGASRDDNGNGMVDISGNANGDFLVIEHGGGPLRIIATWDDWGGPGAAPAANSDIDLVLLQLPHGGQPVMVAQSSNPQNGRARPQERIGQQVAPGMYALFLKAARLQAALPLHVYVQGARDFAPKNASGSISSPGSAHSALTVGAMHATRQTLESYSSQGPTDDGRLKPEIVAPAGNSSVAMNGKGGKFPGTSAAAPHAAGFAALVKQAQPQLKQAELREAVIHLVREIERPAPNNRVGHGHIDAGQVRVAQSEPPAPPRPPASTPPNADSDLRKRMRPIAPLFDLLGK